MKSLVHSILFPLFCLALCVCLSPAAWAAEGEVFIPNNVAVIEAEAFAGDTAITTVTIPASVTEIGERAFYGCTNIQKVYYRGTEEQWAEITIGGGNEALASVLFAHPIFPDPQLRAYAQKSFDTDGNGFLSEAEMRAVTRLDISGTAEEPGHIESLEGIEQFPNLTWLNCSYNPLTALDLSGNPALKQLLAMSCNLSSIDLSRNTELVSLNVNDNRLEALDVSACTKLQSLGCEHNELQTLDLSRNSALTDLNVCNNMLTLLDVSNLPGLHRFWVHGNGIPSIDVSACPTIVDAIQNGERKEKAGFLLYRLGDGPFPGSTYNYNFWQDLTTQVICTSA